MTSIEGGTTPFYVEAAGASVTIQGLRFIRPKGDAILVYAVSGLMIASCKVEGIVPLPQATGASDGIDVITSDGLPNPANPGKPEKVAGTRLIVDAYELLIVSLGTPTPHQTTIQSPHHYKTWSAWASSLHR